MISEILTNVIRQPLHSSPRRTWSRQDTVPSLVTGLLRKLSRLDTRHRFSISCHAEHHGCKLYYGSFYNAVSGLDLSLPPPPEKRTLILVDDQRIFDGFASLNATLLSVLYSVVYSVAIRHRGFHCMPTLPLLTQ